MVLVRPEHKEAVMRFGEIVAPTIKELFVEKIEGMILSGRLAAGERIPPERDLAEEMKISKTVVHAGMQDLQRMGFIKVLPRQGTFVSNYAETGTLETLNAILRYNGGQFDKANTESLFEFRLALEGAAFKKFAKEHTDEDIAALEEKIDDIRRACEQADDNDYVDIANRIFDFHHALCVRSRNMILPLVLNAFRDAGIIFWENSVRIYGKEQSIKHLEIFISYLKKRDAEGATNYLQNGFDHYLSTM